MALAASVVVIPLGAMSTATADESSAIEDEVIVGATTELPATEVAAMEVTDPAETAKILAQHVAEGGSRDVLTSPMTVYRDGDQITIVATGTPLHALRGRNSAGQIVTMLAPETNASWGSGQAGYAVPGPNAFKFLRDGYMSTTVGTWKREIWYLWNKANNWRPADCDTCTRYDYYRGTYKMRFAALTGSTTNEGYKRAWIENDFAGASGFSSFEPVKPNQSYSGVTDTTTTIGFGGSVSYSMGAAPRTAGGEANFSYSGSMTKSSENWHPVVRAENLTGGVQYCRYTSAEYTGTKMVATRVSAKNAASADSYPGFVTKHGMSDSFTACPTQD